MIPNARLCKASVDRITDRAHIIETGTESYRFRRTLEKRKTKVLETKSYYCAAAAAAARRRKNRNLNRAACLTDGMEKLDN